MPSNFLTEYRERFEAFHSEFAQQRFQIHTAQNGETEYLHSEFSDLFSQVSIQELKRELDAAIYENDRAGIKILYQYAINGSIHARVRELEAEIIETETRSRIQWEGESISFSEAGKLLRNDLPRHQRLELFSRRNDVIKVGNDLRAERLEKIHDAVTEADHYTALQQNLSEINYENLASQFENFLSFTQGKYVNALASALNVRLDEATEADLFSLRDFGAEDQYFPAWQMVNVYRETMSEMGIFTYQQNNFSLIEASTDEHLAIEIPDDIKVIYHSNDGINNYQRFFHEASHAQQFAWTSRQIFPEFQRIGDAATREGFALLFESLLEDEKWLSDLLRFHESPVFRHRAATFRLFKLRRYAAKLQYEIELHSNKIHSSAGSRYVELLSEAVRVRYDETAHLRDVSEAFYSGDFLRAHAFASQLREQLKTKFGSRWWASRKAGDYLIDLWNTGGRYKIEELAKMIDLGDLSFDWLAEESVRNLA
jgi:hypothetical protein